jgi:hypothetical protein
LLGRGNLGGAGSAALTAPAAWVGDGPVGFALVGRDFGLPLDALMPAVYNGVR